MCCDQSNKTQRQRRNAECVAYDADYSRRRRWKNRFGSRQRRKSDIADEAKDEPINKDAANKRSMARQILKETTPIGIKAEQKHRQYLWQPHLQDQTRISADDHIQVITGNNLPIISMRNRVD